MDQQSVQSQSDKFDVGKCSCIGCGCAGALLFLVLILLQVVGSNNLDNTLLNPVMKWHMWSITREWGRLAPLPDSAEKFRVVTSGSMFNRQFNATFRAPLKDTKKWLDESPGTAEVAPVEENTDDEEEEGLIDNSGSKGLGATGTWYYEIKPGGDANYAGVWVNVETGVVRIKVWWS